MLTQQLKELDRYGIIERTVHNTIPPMVEYSLTDSGKSLIPIMSAMDEWGKNYVHFYR